MKTTRGPLIMLIFFASMVNSCKSESDITTKSPRQTENFVFYNDKNFFGEALAGREDKTNNSFTIEQVRVVKDDPLKGHDLLKITVAHRQGCSSFEIIWDGTILESFPEQINIFLQLSGTCDNNHDLIKTELVLDLNEFIGQADLVDRAVFHVLNGSRSSVENDLTTSHQN